MPTSPVTASKPPSQFYTWRDYRCAYELYTPTKGTALEGTPLLLLHPIGVGLSRYFWHRFCRQWYQAGYQEAIYNPDLLGCGESEMPHVAYHPTDWAEQLQYFLQEIVKKPVVLLVQGAELPVALALVQKQTEPNYIKGIVLSGPPAWTLITEEIPTWKQKLAWNIFSSPVGNIFYRYARRRQFLQSFSERQLFADNTEIDSQWLDTLEEGAVNLASRHAVFSFLAGFWRKNYQQAIEATHQPTLVVVGEKASSISSSGKSETPQQRIDSYIQHLPQGQARKIPGRNVLPYESTAEFADVVGEFVNQLKN